MGRKQEVRFVITTESSHRCFIVHIVLCFLFMAVHASKVRINILPAFGWPLLLHSWSCWSGEPVACKGGQSLESLLCLKQPQV